MRMRRQGGREKGRRTLKKRGEGGRERKERNEGGREEERAQILQ